MPATSAVTEDTTIHLSARSNSETAETVRETVMAEQVSHNVVNNSGSAGAAAHADVAANQTNTTSASHGNGINTEASTIDHLATPKQANDHAANVNATTSKAETDAAAATIAAKPSAGEAAVTAAEASTAPPVKPAEEHAQTGQEELVNGVHDAVRQESVNGEDGSGGSVDHSINSDTEGSRAGGAEGKKDGKHHERTNSVKKPATFSKVSVTKSFMAKSASPAPTSQKLGDKPSPASAAAQPAAAKPRLVAKTASSLQSMQRPAVGAKGPGAPDARQVWNKNRPVAPPPPKQFTDEELKQQYGIHLATRLQSDEGGKDSKWADIDDDEEDWAPDTVVWMDGTKSTLSQSEATALQKEQQQAPPQAPKPAEAPKPTPPAAKPSEAGPPKMILKPGSGAQTKLPNGSAATTSSSEKPSLKAKSPAPGPSKSPWAALPPVEAVPLINPPVQQPIHPAALPTQDARAFDSQAPPQPAREIAADTFDRSWHEGEGAPRELFNSSNGRYEPAPEGRRTSMRPDSAFRKPLVMQRPSQSGQAFPEPSAAFQTRTGSQSDGASWGRRRGSSVSQGSIPPGRRMSISRAPDLPPALEDERPQSTGVGHDTIASPTVQKPAFAQQSAWDQQMPPRPEGGVEGGVEPAKPAEDPVKVQERVMREKIEGARKRRQQEEEQKEQEKQERLKAKLAALEGVGKSKKDREAEAAAAAKVATAEKPSQAPVHSGKPEDLRGSPSRPAATSAEVGPALEAQPVPPAPLQQATQQDKLPSPLPPKPQQPAGLAEQAAAPADQAQHSQRVHLSPRAGNRAPFGQQQSPYKPATSSYSSPGDRKQQPFGRSPLTNNDTFPGLAGWNSTTSNGNVWGVSGIGNGTFEKTSSFALPTSQQTSTLPPPPGINNSRVSPQTFGQETRSPSLHPAEQQRAFPPPGIDSRPEAAWGQSRGSGASPAPGLGRPAHPPGPIAPPSRAQQQQPVQRPDALSSWKNAAARMPHQYAADADAAPRKQEETPAAAPQEHTFREVFRQTSAIQGRLGGPRRVLKTEYSIHDGEGSRSVPAHSPAPPSTQTQPVGPVPTSSPFQDPRKAAGENTVRIPDGSLNPAHGGLPAQQPPIAPPSAQQPLAAYQGQVNFPTDPLPGVPGMVAKGQSPPPPETSSHPVNSGDASHPNIKLPPPPPVVKLPPSTMPGSPQQMQQTPVMLPHQRSLQAWAPPGVARPIAATADWQARFNGLFNRTPVQTEVPPSPPKTPEKMQGPALAVAPSSKGFLDDVPSTLATVSLPQSPPRRNATVEGFTIDDSGDVISKPAIDPLFTEELSFGSLPAVSVPRNVIYDPDVYTEPQYNMLKQYANSRFNRPIEAQTQALFEGPWNKTQAGIFIKIHGTKLHNRLARHPAKGGRKASNLPADRQPSGRFNKGKEGKGEKSSGSNSPSTSGTPNGGSRKPSFQKAPMPAAVASPAVNNSSAGSDVGPAANGETARKRSNIKPRGRGPAVKQS